jgi:hypothetical protein
MNVTLSFSARSAIAAFKIHHNIDRLKKSLANSDYEATNERGETLLDLCDRLHQRRTVAALETMGAWRAHNYTHASAYTS